MFFHRTILTRSAHVAAFDHILYNFSKRFSHSVSDLSKRDLADLETRLVSTVSSRVKDVVLDQDLGSLQWVHRRIAVSDDGTLQILLGLPSLLHPSLEKLKINVKKEAEAALSAWAEEKGRVLKCQVNVETIATKPVPLMARLVEKPEDLLEELGPGLESVSHFLAVYSCKGGVGKSTVAVNLAYELARMGGRVGLLDLDLYGPSLPVLIDPKDVSVRRSPKGNGMVLPIEHEGVKTLSLGFVAKNSGVPGSGNDNGAAIMRGPLAVKVVAQLLKATDWGELDVLVLDLPPGTGDVQLAVCQDLQLSGAVAVTTPSRLATVDTRKGIAMFTSLGVPTFAVVQNMSYFRGDDGKVYHPFGSGFSDDSRNNDIASIETIHLPISMAANDANETGRPLSLTRPDGSHDELSAFEKLANCVSQELLRTHYGQLDTKSLVRFADSDIVFDLSTINLAIDKTPGKEVLIVRLYSEAGALQKRITAAELRSRDPKTGDIIKNSPFLGNDENRIPETAESSDPMVTVERKKTREGGKRSPAIIPTSVHRRGRYGFGVEFGDGATIIYSKETLARAAGGTLNDEVTKHSVT